MPRRRPLQGPRTLSVEPATAYLTLLGGFSLEGAEGSIAVPHAAQRPLAMLALHTRPLSRVYIAGQLWPEASEERAAGNLRSALWRLRRTGFAGVVRRRGAIALAPWVSVDARELAECASALTGRLGTADDAEAAELIEPALLVGELLPDWYDDWVLIERERIHQLGLHAVEALAARFTRAQRFAEAVDAALVAIRSEPYRESAHRTLIQAYLAEGNQHDALRQYRQFRSLIERDLGLEPSFRLEELIAPHTTAADTGA